MSMSQRVSPTLIGAFVVGALALALVAVVFIGSGRYFRHTSRFVLYFPGSVNGLRVGAAVKFHGVEIGSVEDIRLPLQRTRSDRIEVVIGIDPRKITSLGGSETILDSPMAYQRAIDDGLRGQLQMESFVTGLLFVALEYFPGSTVHFVQQRGSAETQYREIPAEASTTEKARQTVTQVLSRLADADLNGLIDSTRAVVSDLHKLVASPDLKDAIRSVSIVTGQVGQAAGSVSHLAIGLDSNVSTLTTEISSLTADLRQTSVKAGAMIDQAGNVLQHADSAFNGSPVVSEFTRTLQEVSAAARSLRLLTGYLERNPNAIIFGKPSAKEK